MNLSVISFQKKKVSLVSFFGGICILFALVEAAIPKPLPFLRLGIANLPILLALGYLGAGEFFLLGLLKITAQGIYGGTMFSFAFLFSTGGTLSSMLVMYVFFHLFKKRNLISFVGISILGAVFSCAVQTLLGAAFIFGEGMRYVFPLFLLTSGVSGLLLGFFAEMISVSSDFFSSLNNRIYKENTKWFPEDNKTAEDIKRIYFSLCELVLCIIFITLLLYTDYTTVKVALLLIFLFLIFFTKESKKNVMKRLVNLVIFPFFTMLFIVAINLCIPFGKVIFKLGPLVFTEGALLEGIKKAVDFQGTLFISMYFLKSGIFIPGFLGRILGDSMLCFNFFVSQNYKFKIKGFIKEFDTILKESFN